MSGLLVAHVWLRDGSTGRESPIVAGLVDLGSTDSLCNWKVCNTQPATCMLRQREI